MLGDCFTDFECVFGKFRRVARRKFESDITKKCMFWPSKPAKITHLRLLGILRGFHTVLVFWMSNWIPGIVINIIMTNYLETTFS